MARSPTESCRAIMIGLKPAKEGSRMLATLLTAVASFVSTNIDDIFILMILFAQAQSRRAALRVVLGQYLGIGALTALGILGALGTQVIPSGYIGLLGVVPIALGIRAWVSAKGDDEGDQTDAQAGCLGVMLLTMANGADNIGVYIPVFSAYDTSELIVTGLVFAVMVALWCGLGYALISRPAVKGTIAKHQRVLVPAVLIFLGVFILAKSCLL